jgi:hypothetical protein
MRSTPHRLASFAILASVVAAWSALPAAVHAQGRGGPGGGGQQEDEDAKNRKRDEEWGTNQKNLSLPQLRNAGPCPYVKVLYDAARYVEFKGARPSASQAGFTGEIDGLSSACEYKNDQPIHVQARLLFELGRGPQAGASAHTYRYWVAVTDRNRAVLQKEYFDLPVTFPAGQNRVSRTEDVLGIVIPRADLKVSGANFEVLIGFDVTPEMAAFNRQGQRFRVNAGETTASR